MKIVTCYQSTDRQIARIQAVAPNAEIVVAPLDSLSALLPAADIFFGHAKTPVEWRRVVAAGKLKWIQSSAAGLDHCLTEPVKLSPIIVSSASGVFADQVAEQTMVLLLGLVRRLKIFFQAQQCSEYLRRPTDDLHGKCIGIIGLGGNGLRIVEVLQPFQNRILAVDHFHDQKIPGVELLLPPSQLDQLLSQVDVVVVTLPLLDSTYHLIGKHELSIMKKGSYLINVGRGPVVDEAALITALQSEHLAGAGLDVAEVEPLPENNPLWKMDSVIITPHVGAQAKSRGDDVTDLFCENLRRYQGNEPLINQIDKSLGFPTPEVRFNKHR